MRHALFAGAVVGLASLAAAQTASAVPSSTPVPGLTAAGGSVARAADGTMWATEPASPGRVAHIAADGTVTEFTGGITANFSASRSPDQIAITPDGYVWVLTHGGTDEVQRINLATGAFSGYVLTSGTPTSIATGPDGKLWMTATGDNGSADFIARYTLSTTTTTVFSQALTATSEPRSLTAGSDDALYFVEDNPTGRLGRITTDGTVTYRDIGGAATGLGLGPGGALWFSRGAALGLLGADSTSLTDTGAKPTAITTGPDDALWSASTGGVVRIDSTGVATSYSLGLDASAVGTGLTSGSDGRLWMTLDRAPYLVRITVPPRVGSATGSSATPTSASVTADVDPNGLATTAALQLRAGGGSWTTLTQTDVGNGLDSTAVRFDVDGLAADTTQTLRVAATNSAGTVLSATTAVQTAAAPKVEPTPTPSPTPAAAPKAPTTPTPAATPTAAPTPAPSAEPAPVQGNTVVVRPIRGNVTYRVPGSTTDRPVDGAASIPNGSTIDTTSGAITLSSRIGTATQDGTFYGGQFKVKQVKATGMTQLYLRGSLDCPKPGATAASAARATAKGKRRHVWGQDKGGRFQTHGQDSVATVRGTKWLTTDTCAGTVVKVFEGVVSVAPVHGKGKAVTVKAGGRAFTPHTS